MAPLFAGDMPFEISGLKAVEGQIGVPTPKIIAEGVLEGWPYVVLSHLPGEPIRYVWSSLTWEQKNKLVDQIAKIVVNISRCPPDATLTNRFHWNEFITSQYNEWESHQKRKGLPEPWLRSVPEFLHGFPMHEFLCENPVLMHADLTFDHFLVQMGTQPEISGVLDMADCQVGHFEYEIIAPCVFILEGQRELLRRFLIGCGFVESRLNKRLSEKLLAWSLLHRYFVFTGFLQKEMDETSPGDFFSLAHKVFPL